MSGKVDWKQKYKELRSKYMNALDVSYRLGYQEGQKEAEFQSMQKELQAAQEAAEMEAMNEEMGGEEMIPGEEGEIMEEGGEELEGGDELGQSIDELEQYVKGEDGKPDLTKIMKSIHKNEGKDLEKDSSKKERSQKITKMIDNWDNEDSSESTENGEILGQS
jgi:predicted ATPase